MRPPSADRRPELRACCRWRVPRGLLRSDGGAGACGLNEEGQRDLLAPAADLGHAPAAAGARHTVLLWSDGGAVACGSNEEVGVTSQRRSPS